MTGQPEDGRTDLGRLMLRYLDSAASAEEVAEFGRALRADRARRRKFAELLVQCAHLAEIGQEQRAGAAESQPATDFALAGRGKGTVPRGLSPFPRPGAPEGSVVTLPRRRGSVRRRFWSRRGALSPVWVGAVGAAAAVLIAAAFVSRSGRKGAASPRPARPIARRGGSVPTPFAQDSGAEAERAGAGPAGQSSAVGRVKETVHVELSPSPGPTAPAAPEDIGETVAATHRLGRPGRLPGSGGTATAAVGPEAEVKTSGPPPPKSPSETTAVSRAPAGAIPDDSAPLAAGGASYGESIGYVADVEGSVEYTRGRASRRVGNVIGTTRPRWSRAKEGTVLSLGDSVRTRLSRARIVFQSGSTLHVNRFTTLTLGEKAPPLGLSMVGGEVYAETVPEDRGFSVETPHGRAVDLGTRFGLDVGPAGTKVVVVQGRAEASTDEGKVELGAHQEVLLARRTRPPGPVHEARDLDGRLAWARGMKRGIGSTDDIVLSARDAKIRGKEWRFVKDPGASTGFAVEAHAHSVLKENMPRLERGQLGFVEYTFKAEVGRTYHVWIRDRLVATRKPRYLYDLLCLQAEGATWDPPSTKVGGGEIEGGLFDEFIDVAGYRWRSGWGDQGHVTVRFARTGLQKLRLYAIESPVRVDLVWLSTTRTTRPANTDVPRSRERRKR